MKSTTTSIIIAAIIIGGIIILVSKPPSTETGSKENVTINGDRQIVEITAKGGYVPRLSLAKSDIPTILRMKTEGTFDCSSALVIPKLGYSKNLPTNSTTDIPIPAQKSGTTLQGLCAMGMYNFSVQFN